MRPSPLQFISWLGTWLAPRLGETPSSPHAVRNVEAWPWIGAAACAVLYYFAGWWGIHAGSLGDSSLTLVWPASGIAVAAVLIFGYRTCILLFIASAAHNLPPVTPIADMSFPVLSTAVFGLAGATEAAIAAALANRLGRMRSGVSGFLTRSLVAFPVAAAVGAGLLTTAMLLGQTGSLPAARVLVDIWHGVALADYLGMLAVTTPIWIWYAHRERIVPAARWLELAAYLVLAILGLVVRTPIDLYYLLPLACTAMMVRLPLRTAAALVAVLSLAVLWLTSIGLGPLQHDILYETFLDTIIFVAAMNIVAYAIGLLWRDLLRHHRHLEELVRERTNELEKANTALDQLARIDALTGVGNRRHFDECLHRECERARRTGSALCIVAIDVDHFKAINDTHGHATGDLVLKKLAARLSSALRGADVLGRTGGEEFTVMLIECDPNHGARTAERLRYVIAEQPIDTAQSAIPVTISAGIVNFRPSNYAGRKTEEICSAVRKLADRRLYAAKHGGRNQVIAGPEAETVL